MRPQEKDWNERFRRRRTRGLLTLIAIPLLLWASSGMYTGVEGTSDSPPNRPDVIGGAAFCAMAIALIVIDWRLPLYRDPPED